MGSYRNAMELLVEEEVERQIKALPARAAAYINRVELVAYALNQLPSLYATSEKGLDYQIQRGRSKFQDQIVQAVHRALAAIRRDPIRTYAPLQSQNQAAPMREVLHQLRLLLKNDKVDWETLPRAVEQAIGVEPSQGMTWDARYETAPSPSAHKIPPMRQSTRNLGLDVTTGDSHTHLQSPAVPPPPPRRPIPIAADKAAQLQSLTPPPLPAGRQVAQSRLDKLQEKSSKLNGLPRYEQPQPNRYSPEYGWDDPFYTI